MPTEQNSAIITQYPVENVSGQIVGCYLYIQVHVNVRLSGYWISDTPFPSTVSGNIQGNMGGNVWPEVALMCPLTSRRVACFFFGGGEQIHLRSIPRSPSKSRFPFFFFLNIFSRFPNSYQM